MPRDRGDRLSGPARGRTGRPAAASITGRSTQLGTGGRKLRPGSRPELEPAVPDRRGRENVSGHGLGSHPRIDAAATPAPSEVGRAGERQRRSRAIGTAPEAGRLNARPRSRPRRGPVVRVPGCRETIRIAVASSAMSRPPVGSRPGADRKAGNGVAVSRIDADREPKRWNPGPRPRPGRGEREAGRRGRGGRPTARGPSPGRARKSR